MVNGRREDPTGAPCCVRTIPQRSRPAHAAVVARVPLIGLSSAGGQRGDVGDGGGGFGVGWSRVRTSWVVVVVVLTVAVTVLSVVIATGWPLSPVWTPTWPSGLAAGAPAHPVGW